MLTPKLPPRRQSMTSFTSGREGLQLEGTTYNRGDVIANAVVKRIRNLSSLLSRRWIIPNRDQSLRRGSKPTPVSVSVAERKAL